MQEVKNIGFYISFWWRPRENNDLRLFMEPFVPIWKQRKHNKLFISCSWKLAAVAVLKAAFKGEQL